MPSADNFLDPGIGDSPVDGADFHIDPDPEPLLNTIADVMRKKNLVPALESSAQRLPVFIRR
jgi:hypothetical protein